MFEKLRTYDSFSNTVQTSAMIKIWLGCTKGLRFLYVGTGPTYTVSSLRCYMVGVEGEQHGRIV